jgi:GNAT superfamily N-acetyltransferase
MSIRIRPAVRDDCDDLARLASALNKQQGEGESLFDAEAIRRDGFGNATEFAILVAETVTQTVTGLVGYALYCDAYETGYAARGYYLCDIFVEPAARRRGIGRSLVASVAKLARDQDRSFVWWASKEWNTEAQAFYDSLGAVSEPVVAHALVFDVFEALAREAPALAAAQRSPAATG